MGPNLIKLYRLCLIFSSSPTCLKDKFRKKIIFIQTNSFIIFTCSRLQESEIAHRLLYSLFIYATLRKNCNVYNTNAFVFKKNVSSVSYRYKVHVWNNYKFSQPTNFYNSQICFRQITIFSMNCVYSQNRKR